MKDKWFKSVWLIYIYAARNWWLTKLVGWDFVFSCWSYLQCFSCCYIWAGAPICYLELLEKVQKWICRNVGSSFAASREPLAHCQNVASLSLFYLVGAHQSIYLSMHIYIYIYIIYIYIIYIYIIYIYILYILYIFLIIKYCTIVLASVF